MMRRIPICFLALIGGVAAFAVSGMAGPPGKSLYRPDAPAVLEPAPKATPPVKDASSAMVRRAFSKAYRNAGSPRMAVLWNRTFSDRLKEHESRLRVVHSRRKATRTKKEGKIAQNMTSSDESALSVEHRKSDARPSPLSEIAGFQFEAGYMRSFLEVGANLINRASVMRLTHAKNVRENPSRTIDDRQFIETEALKDHADLVIQILMAPSPESKPGAFFRVSVLDIGTGEMKANFFNDLGSKKSKEREKWTAARGGYVRVKVKEDIPDINSEEMGRILALQTMSELLRVWE